MSKLLSDESLISFVNSLNVKQEDRDLFASKIPYMNEEERKDLFDALNKIYLLGVKKEETVRMVNDFWEK